MVIKSVFTAATDQCQFVCKTNGDMVNFHGVHLDEENAIALTTMITSGKELKVVIKYKEDE